MTMIVLSLEVICDAAIEVPEVQLSMVSSIRQVAERMPAVQKQTLAEAEGGVMNIEINGDSLKFGADNTGSIDLGATGNPGPLFNQTFQVNLPPPWESRLVGHISTTSITIDNQPTKRDMEFQQQLEALMEEYHIDKVDVAWKREWNKQ